jgi:hypothetical protein
MAWGVYIPENLFPVRGGRIRVTAAAAETGANLFGMLTKHLDGEWGDDPYIDFLANRGYNDNGPILTKHLDGEMCILTEPDRSFTTVMLAQRLADYDHYGGDLDYAEQYEDLVAYMLEEDG